jgi:NADPH:quinone reductase-like Zn-dependent oxidoreductase
MKAIVLNEFGGPEVLRYEDVSVPKPAAGEVLLRVQSVSVNRTLDLVVRAGKYPVKIQMPHVLGVDPAGEIAGIGAGVDGFKIGDRVAVVSFIACRRCKQCLKGEEACCIASQHIGLHRWGGYAGYVVVPAGNAFKLPDNVSYAQGSVIVRHFPLAFNQLTSKVNVKPGQWVLVMGATGALGSCCIQVAKLLGATVIAGAGTDQRVELAKSYGADFGINYRRQDLLAEVMSLTGTEGVDVVCENISDPTLWPGAFNSLAINGTMVTAGAHGGGTVTLDMRRLYMRRLRIIGTAGTNVADVYKALDAAAQGKIHAIIGSIMPLRDAAQAHRIVEKNQFVGKIILDPTAS